MPTLTLTLEQAFIDVLGLDGAEHPDTLSAEAYGSHLMSGWCAQRVVERQASAVRQLEGRVGIAPPDVQQRILDVLEGRL